MRCPVVERKEARLGPSRWDCVTEAERIQRVRFAVGLLRVRDCEDRFHNGS